MFAEISFQQNIIQRSLSYVIISLVLLDFMFSQRYSGVASRLNTVILLYLKTRILKGHIEQYTVVHKQVDISFVVGGAAFDCFGQNNSCAMSHVKCDTGYAPFCEHFMGPPGFFGICTCDKSTNLHFYKNNELNSI